MSPHLDRAAALLALAGCWLAAAAASAAGGQGPSSTGCGTPTSSPATRSARTPSSSRTRTSGSRSQYRTGATTGRGSPPASSPTPHRTCSPTTWQVPAVRDRKVLGRWTTCHQRHRHEPVPARPGRAVEVPGRQAVRRPEGLGHRRASSTTGTCCQGRRRHPAAAATPATWNPTDGGTFEKIVAQLTVDTNGKRGDQPGFDKNHVKTYGLGFDARRGRLGADPGRRSPAAPASRSTRTPGARTSTTTTRASRRRSPGGAA